MRKLPSILLACAVMLIAARSMAQGCSDAGVCSIGHLRDSLSAYQNTVELRYGYALGLADVTYHNAVMGAEHTFNTHWKVAAQVTYNQASGNFGTRGQFGDFFLLARYARKDKRQADWIGSFGAKIPLNFANLKINEIALPMDYQSSLGTFDALLSVLYRRTHWQLESAFQIPVVQSNRNSFFDEYSASNVFPTTNLFRRKADGLVRATYKWSSKNGNWMFRPNAMAIYHFGQDTYVDLFGQRQSIANSDGWTINASWISTLLLNDRSALELNLATPLKVRAIRPDGLTRAFVSSLAYTYKF